MNKLYKRLEKATKALIFFTSRSWEVSGRLHFTSVHDTTGVRLVHQVSCKSLGRKTSLVWQPDTWHCFYWCESTDAAEINSWNSIWRLCLGGNAKTIWFMSRDWKSVCNILRATKAYIHCLENTFGEHSLGGVSAILLLMNSHTYAKYTVPGCSSV